jgi:nucleoside-diphosphate-sugar epimerase
MKVLILGMDGYIGWPLACTLAREGHQIKGVDNRLRRKNVEEMGSMSAIPIVPLEDRVKKINELRSLLLQPVTMEDFDISANYKRLKKLIRSFKPEVIFHLAQQPSAPFSMKSRRKCIETHHNNVDSTLNVIYAMKEAAPLAHLITIGTMGEYGTPDVPIPEGRCEVNVGGHSTMMPFPRNAGSWYHQTKVHSTHNLRMACNHWGLRVTDIMQGIVYGTGVEATAEDELLRTRLDFDDCFGTVVNRFVVAAVLGEPLPIYGQGTQTRSLLPLQDSINCLKIVMDSNHPGGYHEINQFHEYYQIHQLAQIVSDAYREVTGEEASIIRYANPRVEKEEHLYEPECKWLKRNGYESTSSIESTVKCMIFNVLRFKKALAGFKKVIAPTVSWVDEVGTIFQLDN